MREIQTLEVLPGEGDVQTITRRRVREVCRECDEPAHYKVSFLLNGYRNNPASTAYGRDDCSWCEDDHCFACREHKDEVRRHPPNGYCGASTYPATERFAHMFLRWEEVTDDSAL